MANNIRSKPIEGHVTDSAGNILRNANVVIKQPTALGIIVCDSIVTDDDGHFLSIPLPNGVYDIYESGSKISSVIHSPDSNKIQSFKANSDNFDISSIEDFNTLAQANKLNSFKAFVQLESLTTDVYQYGNIFSIYDKDISNSTEFGINSELFNLAQFMSFTTDSRITLERFDIQYYSPLTSSNSYYKKIRWAGVPAIKFFKDSRLILPLDYFSIIPNNPKISNPLITASAVKLTTSDQKISTLQELTDGALLALSYSVLVGDIIKISFSSPSTSGIWYGIVNSISAGTETKTLILEKWKSSNFSSTTIPTGSWATAVQVFDGMFSGIMDINEEANQRFSVVENIYAQNGQAELYNYNNQNS